MNKTLLQLLNFELILLHCLLLFLFSVKAKSGELDAAILTSKEEIAFDFWILTQYSNSVF